LAADIVFLCFVLYGLVFGMRRGFYKELIAFCALAVAVGAARTWKDPAGRLIQSNASFLGTGTAHVLGAIVVFCVTFFVVTLIGRLILKKIRNPDGENNLEKAADGVADAAQGDTQMGPVTLLTNPVAKAHKSVVYWSDKLLGGVLGVVKGAGACYAIFAVIYFVDLHVPRLGFVKEHIANSRAKMIYTDYLAGVLRGTFTEYRVMENAATTERLVRETKAKGAEPQLIERLAAHPNWAAVKGTQAFKDLAADPDIQAAWKKTGPDGKRDLDGLFFSAKVRRLLADEQFQDAFADTNIEEVIRSIAAPPPPPPKSE
jgi:uncharacterized membrane protein required for colicin V production